jgi:tRNA pseudouridine55 synthase
MNNDILPFWQEIGTSTSIIAKRVSEKLGIPTSHTGTLDPLASGVVLILKGDEYFKKENYIQKDKTYEFEILFGYSTDTHDALGLIENIAAVVTLSSSKIEEAVMSFKGLYHQRYPDFSSKKIDGKSLWEYKRLGLNVPNVYIDGEILEIEISGIEEIASNYQIQLIRDQISKIKGNFRQEEILSKYESTKFPETFIKVKIKVVMSRGLYVRGLVRDISEKIELPGIAINLVRIKDGEFSKNDCAILEDYFSKELINNPNYFEPDFKEIKKL